MFSNFGQKLKSMDLNITIRTENSLDHNWVVELTEKAFETLEISDHNEGKLVDRLRKAPTFVEGLSFGCRTQRTGRRTHFIHANHDRQWPAKIQVTGFGAGFCASRISENGHWQPVDSCRTSKGR